MPQAELIGRDRLEEPFGEREVSEEGDPHAAVHDEKGVELAELSPVTVALRPRVEQERAPVAIHDGIVALVLQNEARAPVDAQSAVAE